MSELDPDVVSSESIGDSHLDLSVTRPEGYKPPGTDSVRTVKAICPTCSKKYRLEERYGGRTLKCRACGYKFQIPRDISIYHKPVPPPVPAWKMVARRVVTFLQGGKADGKPGKRLKWIPSDAQIKKYRWAIGAAAVCLLVGLGFLYMQTDSAKIRFGHQAGKEIAFERIVRLKERSAERLAVVQDKGDVKSAARAWGGYLEDEADLWQTLADWKSDGFLNDGEISQFLTRLKPRLTAADGKLNSERLRIARLDVGAVKPLNDAYRRASEDLELAKSQVITPQGLPKRPGAGEGGRSKAMRDVGL